MIATNVPHRRSLLIASMNNADKRQSPFKSFAITELTHILSHIFAARLELHKPIEMDGSNAYTIYNNHPYKSTLAAPNQSITDFVLYMCYR